MHHKRAPLDLANLYLPSKFAISHEWHKLFGVIFLGFLPLSADALKCYQCSHTDVAAARHHIYDRVEASPQLCDKVGECEGKWCVQQLDGTNVSFYCADYSLLSDTLWDKAIDSQCRASFGQDDGVVHATCYCRGSDYCNAAPRNFSRGNTLLINLLIHSICLLLTSPILSRVLMLSSRL
ncbi:hypothetical protein Ddc_06413 [Ditylenchus destructor]|nr:hypothetical protein Ddc_06413 [Ditylenchus destructor]